MLRGIVNFSKTQVVEVLSKIQNMKDTLLYIKMKAGMDLNAELVPVELSEEEIEIILDEIGIEGSKDLRGLLNESLLKWRF